MKFSVVLLFALIVIGTLVTGRASAVGQCSNIPNPIQTLRIGNLIRGPIKAVIRTIIQITTKIFSLIIPENSLVPVEAILTNGRFTNFNFAHSYSYYAR